MPSKADIRALRRVLESRDVASALAAYLSRFKAKRKAPSVRAALKKQRRETRSWATARIREHCILRAGGICECGCRRHLGMLPQSTAEMDHFVGRAFSETIETCWILRRDCHRLKTENYPDRGWWDSAFRLHCERHGYPRLSRLVKAARSAPKERGVTNG